MLDMMFCVSFNFDVFGYCIYVSVLIVVVIFMIQLYMMITYTVYDAFMFAIMHVYIFVLIENKCTNCCGNVYDTM